MVRPLRIEYAGALYHVTARGNERKAIYRTDTDRHDFLELLYDTCQLFHWHCHAYCLMDNHYHLLIETGDATLSKGMRHLNGRYSQTFNARHGRSGHLLQGRFKGILVQKEGYLLEVARYIVLNPVRARMVHAAREWPWSSYRATAGASPPHPCLTRDWILGAFGTGLQQACNAYRVFVKDGAGQPGPWEHLKNQVYLGSEQFVEDALQKISPDQPLTDIAKAQRLKPIKPLAHYQRSHSTRNEAMAHAWMDGHYSMTEIGAYFKVGKSTVSRAIKTSCGKWEA